jgi:thiopeptide-type bacteriocin biosynthesis protein
VELVALAVADAAAPAAPAVQRVPPPRERRSLSRWRTFKLFGAAERQDGLLQRVVGPVVEAARQAGELDRWSFLRYVDGPGRRDHLRVRVHGQPARVENRLRVALTAARAVGDVTAFETADYLRELGRYGESVELVERVAESDSLLVLGLLRAAAAGEDGEQDIADLLVRAHDATCAALGLDAGERRALARRRRDAHAGDLDPDAAAGEFRRRQAHLRAILGGARSDFASALFAAHAARLAGLAVPPELLPELLHLASVRLAGPDPAVEALAYVLWERTLEGLTRRPSPPRSSPP